MMTTTAPAGEFDAMRSAMVASQLRTTNVADPRVVAAMARVPRERFVPEAVRPLAYRDTPLALGNGRQANLPMVSGRLLTEARLRADDRVLLIGAASGYVAAVLAEIVSHVTAVESDAGLAETARTLLGDRVTVVEGALEKGDPDGGPYDVLVVDGAVEELPHALLDQVRPGGRIVTGLVDRGVTRLAAGQRTETAFGLTDFADADCVVLPGFSRPRTFVF